MVDVHGTIRYIESGYHGHLNDAQQYVLMQEIGAGIHFLDELVLLGDKMQSWLGNSHWNVVNVGNFIP